MGRAVAKTLGQAVTNSASRTAGAFKSVNFGANFGASFARSSNVTATIGKSEGINQSFTNYNIKHALEILEAQMKRLELSTALGIALILGGLGLVCCITILLIPLGGKCFKFAIKILT